jgi:hypothetical protein
MKNFRSNLKTLRKDITDKIERASFDSDALAKDREIHPRANVAVGGYPRWDGSEARRLFLEDFALGLHLQMMELLRRRQEFT